MANVIDRMKAAYNRPHGFNAEVTRGGADQVTTWARYGLYTPDIEQLLGYPEDQAQAESHDYIIAQQYIDCLNKLNELRHDLHSAEEIAYRDAVNGYIAEHGRGASSWALRNAGYTAVTALRANDDRYIQKMGELHDQYRRMHALASDPNNHATLIKQGQDELEFNRRELEKTRQHLKQQGHLKNYSLEFGRNNLGSPSLWDQMKTHAGARQDNSTAMPKINQAYGDDNKMTSTIFYVNTAPLYYDAGYLSPQVLKDDEGYEVNLTVKEIRELAISRGYRVSETKDKLVVKFSQQEREQWLQTLRKASKEKRKKRDQSHDDGLGLETGGDFPSGGPRHDDQANPGNANGSRAALDPRNIPPPPEAPEPPRPAAPRSGAI